MPDRIERSDQFDVVVERIRAGESVLVPTPTAGGTGVPLVTPGRAAMVVAVIAAFTLVLTVVPPVRAMWSELKITPARPRAGSELALEYRATDLLNADSRLTVRARVRTPRDGRTARTVELGTLTRDGDGLFRGVVSLADSVVYAVLAIESEDGARLDVNGERWEVLVHGADDRPLVTALLQRRLDASQRDVRIERDVASQLVALYPERPEGWDAMWIGEATRLGNAAVDSLSAYHRAHYLPGLDSALRADPAPDVLALGSMVFYTSRLRDSVAMQRWKVELYRRYPGHGFALMWRTFDLDAVNRGDAAARMRAYERMWVEVGPTSSQLTLNALQLAARLEDAELVRRWGERMERTDSSFTDLVASTMARFPELRRHAVERMQSQVEAALDVEPVGRPLRYTTAEYRQHRAREAGALLSRIGVLLLAEGDTIAALRALSQASAGGWDPQRFQSLGEIHLGLGDTARATAAFARVAVDPFTPQPLADTVRARLETVTSPAWDAARADARTAMLEGTWSESTRRRPGLTRLRLLGADGRSMEHELRGTVTFLAFWSRYCPYSVEQLADVARVAAQLESRGVRVLIVTDESEPDSVTAYLRGRGVGFATWLDIERDAHNAFDNRATPAYFVLDREGTVRFTGHSPAAVPRQVEALLSTNR
jgi:hypothetical protein